FQAEDGIRDFHVTGVQTCALPISDLLKFYTAIHSFQNKYNDDELDLDAEPLKQIIKNPLGLDFYIHDRKISESVSPKTLSLVKFEQLHAEIKLSVFKKEPFYEITGELLFND